jgi:hypothetical protein
MPDTDHDEASAFSQLSVIWSELLEVPVTDVSLQSDFYELGGNSMLLLSLQIAIANDLAVEVALGELLDSSNFADQLQLIAPSADH